VGTGVFGEDMVNDIVRVFGNIFLIAFKISAPITISIMISEVALGIVSKQYRSLMYLWWECLLRLFWDWL